VAPVYRGDVLEGVVGLDVTVARLAEMVMDFELPYEAPALLLTAEGALLGLNHAAARRFPDGAAIVAEPRAEGGREEHTLDAALPLAQLVDDEQAARSLARHLADEQGEHEVTIDGEVYLMTHATAKRTGWRLALLVRRDHVVEPATAIEAQTRRLGLSIMMAMAVFYMIFFHWVYRSSKSLADSLTAPLDALVRASRRRGRPDATSSGIVEVDELVESFGSMVALTEEHQREIEQVNAGLERQVEQALAKVREREDVMMAQTHRLAAGGMVASIAHHWRQPLMTMQLLVDELRMDAEAMDRVDERQETTIVEMDETIGLMNQVVGDFAQMFRPRSGATEMALEDVVSQGLTMADGALREAGIEARVECDEEAERRSISHGVELGQVVLSLLAYATEALRRRGAPREVVVTLRSGETASVVDVRWNAAEPVKLQRPSLLEDVTGEAVGLGLGVYLSRRLVERRWGGKLEVLCEEMGVVIEIPFRGCD